MTAALPTPALPLLLGASLLLLMAHVARAARIALLFPPGYIRQRFDLLLALSIGYAVDAVAPWRFGEFVRIWFVSEREPVRLAYSAAVVAAERFTDLLAIGLIVALLALAFPGIVPAAGMVMLVTLCAGATLFAFALAIARSTRVRGWIWRLSWPFNQRVRLGIADFCWSFSEVVRGGMLFGGRYVVASMGMWALYFAAYWAFAAIYGASPFGAIALLVGTPFQSMVVVTLGLTGAWPLLVFLMLPIVAVMVWGVVKQGDAILRLLTARRRFGFSVSHGRGTAFDRFRAQTEYEVFLGSLFGGSNQTLTGFGLDALDDGVVHKLFAGGSDAITALVEVDDQLVIRKFAAGAPGDKLEVQHRWLAQHGDADLPLVKVARQRRGPGFFLYDMPLVIPANDFYDVIHTSPPERSAAILREVGAAIDGFHRLTRGPDAPDALVARFLSDKAIANATVIRDFARSVLPGGSYTINGATYSLAEWDRLLDPKWLMQQVADRSTCVIHGDLTIENIIVAPEIGPGWYIIDPNPDNVFDTPLIDWAKMMQSLHLGYESINRNFDGRLVGKEMLINVSRSALYHTLHDELERMIGKYRPEALREVYFYELINYLRLTPYKIRQNGQKGLFFFACTSLLLRRYVERQW